LDTTKIIEQIDLQISQLQEAKALLTGTVAKKGPGRPEKSTSASISANVKPAKRTMSAEGKAKIAAAQQARWAKVRRAAKKAAKAEATAEAAA
jgi:hypothetical protein